MCGRYVVTFNIIEISKEIECTKISGNSNSFAPSFNIGLGDLAPVITMNNYGQKEMDVKTFGFTPSWSKKQMYLINARSEGDHNKENNRAYTGPKGILKKPAFKRVIRTQRCIIPANGYYEGPQIEKLSKPYYIYPADKNLLTFAGVWDNWINEETGEKISTYAILTTFANKLHQKIGHHRSPVIISKAYRDIWLNSHTSLDKVLSLLRPTDKNLIAHPVSKEVKKKSNNYKELIQPIEKPIEKDFTFVVQKQLSLEGMGMTRSRKRKNK